MTESGILGGNLLNFVAGNESVIQNHEITATRQSDGAQYSALTDEDGNFRFEPLRAGTCEVTANTAEGLWAGKTSKEVHAGSPDGKPFKVHPWVKVVSVDYDRVMATAYVDASGYFEARGVEPGRYIVGLGIRGGQVLQICPLPFTTPAFGRRHKQPSFN